MDRSNDALKPICFRLLIILALVGMSPVFVAPGLKAFQVAYYYHHQSEHAIRSRNLGSVGDRSEDENKKPREVAYITYTSLIKGTERRFEDLILGGLKTWLKDESIFVVLNKQWNASLETLCSLEKNVEVCQRVIPIFVDCPEGYYSDSPCCKMDRGLATIWKRHPEFDWYVYQDDDMYIRTEYMKDYLRGLNRNDPMVLTSKAASQLGYNNNCSDAISFRYPWGQPVVYSNAGLEKVVRGFKMGAMRKQCKEFTVTHDVGNPIVHWMYGLPEVRLPDIPPSPPGAGKFGQDLMGAHAVGREGKRSVRDLHEEVKNMSYPRPPYEYTWHKPNGFLETETYRRHGKPSEWKNKWHTMPVSDCLGPVHGAALIKKL